MKIEFTFDKVVTFTKEMTLTQLRKEKKHLKASGVEFTYKIIFEAGNTTTAMSVVK